MPYLSPKQAAEKWGITQQRVTELCRAGAVTGAWREGRRWRIPDTADKPAVSHGPFLHDEQAEIDRVLRPPDFPPIPLGVSFFEAMLKEGYSYIDKSLLIKEVLDSNYPVIMFLRPRRFGKTLNMDMLRRFFEASEEDTSYLFRDLLIWRADERYLSKQGKYPTVWLSLKDVRGDSWEDAFLAFKGLIRSEFDRHKELIGSSALCAQDHMRIEAVKSESLADGEWFRALYDLSEMLHKHHGQKIAYFIDEYDAPIQHAYLHGFYDQIIEFMRPFISILFKDNPHLYRGFLSGVTRVAKESIFSGLNNLYVDSLVQSDFPRYFGFTYGEVRALFEQHGRPDMFSSAIRWYDGYRVEGIELFNPWSILMFVIRDFEPGAYWQQTGSSEIIRQIIEAADPEILDMISELVGGGQVEVDIDSSIAYPQVEGNPRIVFSFLLMAGYLCVDKRLDSASDWRPLFGTRCLVRIPNEEIREAYAREVIGGQPNRASESAAERIRRALFDGDAEALEENLGRYVREVVSYHDAVGEAFYHGMVVGLCASAQGLYHVTSNREAGLGRYDVQLAPRRMNDPGIVIEVKAAADDTTDLQELADTATTQILEKDYARDLVSRGVTDILTVGLAFRGKDVAVATLMTRRVDCAAKLQ